MPRRTKEEAQATRDLLLDTAAEVFERRGVSRTSMQDIASAAGLTRGAIYWHFRDKADLFEQMLQRVKTPCQEGIEVAIEAENEDPVTTLLKVAMVLAEYVAANADAARVFAIAALRTELNDELAPIHDKHRQHVNDLVERLAVLFERLRAEGRLRPELSPTQAAWGLFGLLDGLMRRSFQGHDFDLAPTARAAITAYLSGATQCESVPR